ncbi:MAG TPA: efflux transporter outer membrane subunit [Anaeromyxobacteraceae bacterium]|nr:efflux transporter outer membrane subunit [Anaeromyxobacteraceae bacterium]
MTRSLTALALLSLSACAVGPKYQRPESPVPEAWRYTLSADESRSIADLAWWEMYRDPILQGLIEEALRSNQDLRVAAARVEAFRAQVGVAAADFYPQINGGAGASYGQQNAKNYVPGVGATGSFSVNIGLSWELDIWGRVRNATDAAKAELLSSEEFRRGVVLDLVASVAQTYAELMELDVELEVARRNTITRQGTLDLFTKRSQGGVGNDLEVNQARADLAVTAAAIPTTERLIALKESQMAVLLGRPPGPVPRAKAPVQQVAPAMPMGVPAQLLERRPDIRRTEYRVKSATANVGVAIANRLPKLSIEGIIGLAGPSLSSTFSTAGFLGSIGGGLLAPIFQGGRLESLEEAAWAQLDEAIGLYRQQVITAWREVSDAAISVRKLGEAAAQYEVQVTAARSAERLARLRYEGGVSAYLEVLDAQRSLFSSELQLAQTNRDQLVAMVQLYKALGGGWQEKHVEAAPASTPAGEPASIVPPPAPAPQPAVPAKS